MVRRRVEIKSIEDKAKRHTTFTKRRQGLFKKVKDLCLLCDAKAAVITFSKAGNVFGFGHPSVNQIVDRYLEETDANDNADVDNDGSDHEGAVVVSETETREGHDGNNVNKGRAGWEAVVEDMSVGELDDLAEAVKDKLSKVVEVKKKLLLMSGGGEGKM